MEKQIQIISTTIAAFITAELTFENKTSTEIDLICEKSNPILEEIIDYFKSMGPAVFLKGKIVNTTLYNIVCFNQDNAKEYFSLKSKEILESCPVLTIKDFIE